MTSTPIPENLFDLTRIEAATSVRRVVYRDTTPSTNDLAIELAADPALRAPTLVLAGEQTAGRGRGANRWWSAPGALTFSLIVDPADLGLPPDAWPRLSLATAVAACDALARLAPGVALGVKWPNDVVAADRKIGGILIEGPHHAPPTPRRLVVGVGLNVNNLWSEAPAELRATATSLADTTGGTHNLTEVLVRLLESITDRWEQLRTLDTRLPTAWRQLCVLRGRSVAVEIDHDILQGHCQGIAEDGALLVESEQGLRRLTHGVVCRVSDRPDA